MIKDDLKKVKLCSQETCKHRVLAVRLGHMEFLTQHPATIYIFATQMPSSISSYPMETFALILDSGSRSQRSFYQ